MGRPKNTKEDFIKKAKLIHGDKYDYSLVEYIGANKKVKIICDVHGEIEQTPSNHLNQKVGCKRCSKRKNQDDFIQKCKNIHNGFYGYDRVKYISSKEKIEIYCPIHGYFWQKAHNHELGHKCIGCDGNDISRRQTKTNKDFINKSIEKHGDFYDYSISEYINSKEPIDILCKKHGKFTVVASYHLNGFGYCPVCKNEMLKNKEPYRYKIKFSEARKIVQKYNFISKQDFYERYSELPKNIIPSSPQRRWKDDWISWPDFLGYNKCVSMGHEKVKMLLEKLKINFKEEKKFSKCRNKNPLPFDFYLPDHNILIEVDGKQHFEPIESWGGERTLSKIQKRDQLKNEFAKKSNIKLIRIPYWEFKDKEYINTLKNNITS